jgi:hypothetical protein
MAPVMNFIAVRFGSPSESILCGGPHHEIKFCHSVPHFGPRPISFVYLPPSLRKSRPPIKQESTPTL